MNEPRKEPNHLARIAIGWVILAAIATPIVVVVIAPNLPPYNGSSASSSQVHDNTVLLAVVTPIAALMIVYFAYALIVFRRRGSEPGDGPADRGDPRVHVPWLAITIVIVLFLADLRHVRARRGRLRRRPGPDPGLQARRQRDAGAGDRPAVGVHLPLPDLRRRRDAPPGAPGRPADRAARHLARRDPLLLGAEAGDQGRRQPGGRQRRLHEADHEAGLRHPLQRALRPVARLHVRPGRGRQRPAPSRSGSAPSGRSTRR